MKGGRKGDVILFILTGYIHLLTTVCGYKHTWYPGNCVLTSLTGALLLNKGTVMFEHVKMASICCLMWFFMTSLKTAEEESRMIKHSSFYMWTLHFNAAGLHHLSFLSFQIWFCDFVGSFLLIFVTLLFIFYGFHNERFCVFLNVLSLCCFFVVSWKFVSARLMLCFSLWSFCITVMWPASPTLFFWDSL